MEKSLQYLFTKYLTENCSNEEIQYLMEYFKLPENELLLKQLIIEKLRTVDVSKIDVPNLNSRLDIIHLNVQSYIKEHQRKTISLWKLWKRVAIASMIILTTGAGLWYYKQKQVIKPGAFATLSDINPGKNAATLTLANGQKILLSNAVNGVLAKQPGVSITKTANGQVVYNVISPLSKSSSLRGGTTKQTPVLYNTLSTANGEQYSITMPDGSIVTLNASSSITYPTTFANLNERKVMMTGEAYFVVKHNSRQPFKVSTLNQLVEDIGTEFNINAYNDEPVTKTTLVEGSAKVSSLSGGAISPSLKGETSKQKQNDNDAIVLTSGQQAVLSGIVLKVNTVDVGIYTAWKDGHFAYKNTSLQEVMRQVGRWYNAEIEYQTPDLKLKRLSGSVSRYDKVSGILHAIEYTTKVKFKIENRKILVIKDE